MAVPRILLVGAGTMGSYHARVIAQSPHAELTGLVDPNEAGAQPVADRYGTSWLPELPDLKDVDGVVLAAPTEFHHGLALQILETGTPLLVEKPVADSLKKTEEIIDLADDRDIPLMCGLLERYNPAVLTAMALIENPVHVTGVRHSPYAPRIRTGVAWDLLVHDVDLATRLLGVPVRVSGSLGHFHPSSLPTAEDVASVVLTFENGGLAELSASRVGQRKVRSLVVHELDRLVEIDLLRRDVTVYRNVDAVVAGDDGRGYRQQAVIEIPELITGQEPLAAQFDRFLGILAGRFDAAVERASIRPPHRVVAQVLESTVPPS